MEAVANNPKFAKKVGVPTKVGKEFTKETKVKKYRKGGMSEEDKKTFGETEMDQEPPKNFKKSKPKKPLPEDNPGLKKLPTEVRNKMGYKKKGGMIKKMKAGGMVKKHRGDGCAQRGKTKGRMV